MRLEIERQMARGDTKPRRRGRCFSGLVGTGSRVPAGVFREYIIRVFDAPGQMMAPTGMRSLAFMR